MVGLLAPPAGRGVKLERPQEVGCVLEVGANGQDLVNQIFNANDVVLAQLLFDDVVRGDGGPVSVELCKPAFVDQLPNTLQVGCAPCNVRL